MTKAWTIPTEGTLKFLRAQLLLMLLSFVCVIPVYASPEAKQERMDSSAVKPNKPTAQKDYASDDYYEYDTKTKKVESEETVFDRIWNSFWESLFDSMKNSNVRGRPNWWAILWIVILVALIVLVILKVTNSGMNSVFSGKSKKAEKVDATAEDVDIHSIDFERDIAEAVSRGDHRLAIRLWFLRTLKSLTDKELIHWQIDKTNSDYYYELSGNEMQKDFGTVSYAYDHVWYGDFPIDAESYRQTEYKFRTFNEKVSS